MTAPVDSCGTCWPRPCGEPPYRSMCKRRAPDDDALGREVDAAEEAAARMGATPEHPVGLRPAYGALARAEALAAGHPRWHDVTRWPEEDTP